MNSFISDNVTIGKNVKIGLFCIIEEGVEIGSDVVIGSHTIISKNTIIQNNVKVEPYCFIGSEVFLNSGSVVGPYCEIKNNVIIGNETKLQGKIRIGNRTVICNNTIVKYGAIITSNVYISKNCFIGPNSILIGSDISRMAEVAGGENCTLIGERVFLGAGTRVNASCKIANDVFIGANSYVKSDILTKGLFVGTPVEKIKDEPPNYSFTVIDGVGVV